MELASSILDFFLSLPNRPSYVTEEVSELLIQEYGVESIIKQLRHTNFYSIVVSGRQGSGKTNTALFIVNKLQKSLGGKYFRIISTDFTKDKLLEIRTQVENERYVYIILDDVSYVFGQRGRKEENELKNMIGVIRHMFESSENQINVVLIIITHTVKGVPPILRIANEWLFTSVTAEEYDLLRKYKVTTMQINLLNRINETGKHTVGGRLISIDKNTERVVLKLKNTGAYLRLIKKVD